MRKRGLASGTWRRLNRRAEAHKEAPDAPHKGSPYIQNPYSNSAPQDHMDALTVPGGRRRVGSRSSFGSRGELDVRAQQDDDGLPAATPPAPATPPRSAPRPAPAPMESPRSVTLHFDAADRSRGHTARTGARDAIFDATEAGRRRRGPGADAAATSRNGLTARGDAAATSQMVR